MTGTNEAALRRLFEDVWNGDDPKTADELVHEAYTSHDRDLAEELQGRSCTGRSRRRRGGSSPT